MAIEKSSEPMVLNSTQFPNILLDAIMPLCSPAVWKLLCVIVRQTYGWHKSFDTISLSQLEKKTGLSDRGVRNSIETLKEAGLLIRGPINEHGWSYKIDVNCDLDHAGFILAGVELSSRGGELSSREGWNSVPLGVELSSRTKETTKETIKRNVPAPPAGDKNQITSQMAGRAFCEELGFSGALMAQVAHDSIDSYIRHNPGKNPEESRDDLVALWKDYQASGLHVKVGALKWLTEGLYHHPEKWRKPAVNGNGKPPAKKAETPSVLPMLEEMRKKRERAQAEQDGQK